MKNIFCRAICTATIFAMILVMSVTFSGCNNSNNSNNSNSSKENGASHSTYPAQIYDKNGDPVVMPTDNDEEGWFSAEVLNQHSAPGFILPEGTEVTNKPQRDTLYLKGDENALKLSALYAYDAIRASSDGIYLPVYTIGEDEVVEISSLQKISVYTADDLYPDGEETSVTFIYKSARKIYQCSISLENTIDSGEQVCISFCEKTEEYKALI